MQCHLSPKKIVISFPFPSAPSPAPREHTVLSPARSQHLPVFYTNALLRRTPPQPLEHPIPTNAPCRQTYRFYANSTCTISNHVFSEPRSPTVGAHNYPLFWGIEVCADHRPEQPIRWFRARGVGSGSGTPPYRSGGFTPMLEPRKAGPWA